MLKIKIENNEYILPEGWDEVMLRHFININDYILDSKLSSPTKLMTKLISILADNDKMEEDIKKLDIEDRQELFNFFQWANEEPKFDTKPNKYFEINGSKYTLKSDFNKLTFDENVTIEELIASNKLKGISHYEIALAVLFRKLDDKGNEMELNYDLIIETLNVLKNEVKLKDVYSVMLFFSNGENNTQKSSQSYSKLEIVKGKNTTKKKKKRK